MISNQRFLRQLEAAIFADCRIPGVYASFCHLLRLEDIYTTDAVYIAAQHCASGFRNRNDTFSFMKNAWVNSWRLKESVLNGTFKPAYYRRKEITERGKKRIIQPPKFECKVVQKVLCDYILRSMLEPRMIETCYASVRGKGTDLMYRDILNTLNGLGYGTEMVTTDYRGYFASIPTNRICQIFLSWGMDPRVVNLFHSFDPEGVGLSLGNEASQIPASWYPSEIDHSLQENYGFKHVYRFMDDTLIFTENHERSKEAYIAARKESRKALLSLKAEKTQCIRWGEEFSFCKGRFYFNKAKQQYYFQVNPQMARNEIRKLKRFRVCFESGEMTKEKIDLQYRSVMQGLKSKPNTNQMRRRISYAYRDIFQSQTKGRKEENEITRKKEEKPDSTSYDSSCVDVSFLHDSLACARET